METQYNILAKYSEHILCPSNAIDRAFYTSNKGTLLSMDGIRARATFLSTYNNADGRYDNDLEEICQREFGKTFAEVRNLWIFRLGRLDDYWHFIKLDRDDG